MFFCVFTLYFCYDYREIHCCSLAFVVTRERFTVMKKIARIEIQKKHKDRYNIFLTEANGDEQFAFSVDEAVLIQYRLRKGMELTQATIDELIRQDTVHKAYNLAVRYLSYRMRTEKEMRHYLEEKDVDPEHIAKVMERLINERLIDDRQFAEMFVTTRINTSSKGPVLIQKELMEKGVSSAIAEDEVSKYPYEEQLKKIQRFAEKKMKNSNKSYQAQIQQIKANLLQKGFTRDVIAEALHGMEENRDHEREWQALVKHGEKLLRKHEKKLEGYALKQKVTEGLYRRGFSFDMIQQFLNETLEHS